MEQTENKKQQSNREKAMERLKGRYPDKQFDDDEMAWGQVNDDYDRYDKMADNEKKLSDMFGNDPRSARFITEWKNGGDPVVELVKMYGEDITDAVNDPDKLEEIAAANKEFVERVSKEKKLEEEYQQNLEASINDMNSVQEEDGLSDEQMDAAMSWLIGVIGDGVRGKFAPETIRMAVKAQNYDADMADAAHEGEVRGRNTKIDEKLRKASEGDGVAALNGKNGGSGGGQRANSIFALAAQAR